MPKDRSAAASPVAASAQPRGASRVRSLNDSAKRPTVRAIAALAGVSAITVSRALRRHASVASATRQQVEAVARKLGYRPDPQLGRLMSYLRQQRRPAFQGTVCAITNLAPHLRSDYLNALIAGASARAEARGYAFQVLDLSSRRGSPASLQRMLRSRGTGGILVLPMASVIDLSDLLDWSQFSAVATTTGVVAPSLHRVAPQHFANIQRLGVSLLERGYRRIGLVLHRDDVLRANHTYNAGVFWHGACLDSRPARSLIFTDAAPRGLERWFAAERPDVIVTNSVRRARLFAQRLGCSIPGRVAFALTSVGSVADGLAGIDEQPGVIGATAMDLLANQIQNGERGVPEIPTATLIPGRWVDGASCVPRAARGRRSVGHDTGVQWPDWALRDSLAYVVD